VLAAEADAALSDAERKQAQVTERFREQLDLPTKDAPELVTSRTPETAPALEALTNRLKGHPALVQARGQTEAAEARVSEASASRIPDLNLTLGAQTLRPAGRGCECLLCWTGYRSAALHHLRRPGGFRTGPGG